MQPVSSKYRSLSVVAAAVYALTLNAAPVDAARIQIRARTTLTAQLAARQGQLEIAGDLRDQRGLAVANADIQVSISTELGGRLAQPVHTDTTGRYVARFGRAQLGMAELYHGNAAFAGDLLRGSARAEVTVDLARDQPAVVVLAPQRRWTVLADAWTTELLVSIGNVPLPNVPLELTLDGQPALQLRTNADGLAHAAVPINALRKAGPHRARATLQSTPTRNAAQVNWEFDLIATVELELAAQAGGQGDSRCGHGDWCLRGRASVHDPAAIVGAARAVVQLYAERKEVGSLVAGEDGQFSAVLHAAALEPFAHLGQVQLVARATANLPWTEPGWSPVLILRPPPPSPWQEWASLGALALALALLAWRLRWARRKSEADQLQAQAEQAGLPTETMIAGADGREPCFALRAKVVHGELGRPVACRGLLRAPGGALTVIVSDNGYLQAEDLAAGPYSLSVTCDEHESLHLEFVVPHQGRMDGCTLLPRSCRAVVRGTFAQAIRYHTGSQVDWGRETPRRAESRWASHLRRGRAEIRLAVRAVERALYGRATDTEQIRDIDKAMTRVDEANR